MRTTTNSIGRKTGFTLVEVLISITILSFGSLALGTMLIRASRASMAASHAVYQTAALSSEVGRLGAIPFATLVAGTTCVNVTTGPFRHQRCAVITSLSAKVFQVTVTVTPTGSPTLQARSASFERSIAGTSNGTNPLNQ